LLGAEATSSAARRGTQSPGARSTTERRTSYRFSCVLLAVTLGVLGCDVKRPLPDAPLRPSALPAHSSAPAASSRPLPSPSRKHPPGPEAGIVFRGGGKKVVSGSHGLVTSVEPQATRAGIAILERGGNAVDAAVAVAYALSVTHPSAGNLGGGGFMLVHHGHEVTAIDFRENAPAKLPRARFDRMIARGGSGPDSVGVPGTVAGLCLAHARFGKLELARVLEPAIKLAEQGYVLGPRQHQVLEWSWPTLRKNPAFVARFGRAGTEQPVPRGTRLTHPELATTLKRIAKLGPKGFYEGPVAKSLLTTLGADRLMTAADLENYHAKVRPPLVFWYRGLELTTMPPPSAGGVALAQTLLMLEQERAHSELANSPMAYHLLVEAAKRAHAERRFRVVDPDALDPKLLDARLTRWTTPTSLLSEHPISRTRATRSEEIHPLFRVLLEDENTTHLGVLDAQGMAVSLTLTLSGSFGSKLIADEAGVILNNSVASFSVAGDNLPTGGRRTVSSMAPTFVFANDQLRLVLGTPGGDTIPNTLTQVVRNIVDYGMTLDVAVDAPRIHHGFIPDQIRLEQARPLPPVTVRELERLGHRIDPKRTRLGDANSILLDGANAYAYADPREGGLALAAKPRAAPGE
jgi:gamma-glutamyltranspeptidase/glutathione hydrolase